VVVVVFADAVAVAIAASSFLVVLALGSLASGSIGRTFAWNLRDCCDLCWC
jgi:hypothetical protein